jgi:hypothetical protein
MQRPCRGIYDLPAPKRLALKEVAFNTLASGIRAIHGGNFSRDSGPFQFPSQRFTAANMQLFFPLEQLIGKPKMRLDNYVESTGANVTTVQRHISH